MNSHLILTKLQGVHERFNEVSRLIADPEVASDMKQYIKLNKEYKELEPLMQSYKEYKKAIEDIENAKEILAVEKDEDLRMLAKEEIDTLTEKLPAMEENIKLLLIPADPEDEKNAIVEIRAGSGGDESSIFAGDLYRMYSKFCETQGWRTEVTRSIDGTTGGFKEVIFEVSGAGVYGIMKYESGVHRVQRVPQTEAQGRIHTSAASVAVLPEAEDVDIVINNNDLRVDTFCSSGPGGQSVNTTYSAVRITHLPTNTVVSCQDEKSQIKNREKAMRELRTRLYNIEHQKYLDKVAAQRKTMVSSGDRSAKIRTYNYPQSRVTDHRINYTTHNLQGILDGDINELIEKLQIAENAEKLNEQNV